MQLNLFHCKAGFEVRHHMHEVVNYVVAFKGNLSLNYLLLCERRVTYAL